MAINLVTGGAGFIGSHLVRELLSRGEPVRVLDNFSTGKQENLAGLDDNLEIIEGDLRDKKLLQETLQDAHTVYHQAAMVSVALSMEDPQSCYAVNVQGTVDLLDSARRSGVQKVILASSAAVYGETETLPLNEGLPPSPLSPYAASKLVNEIYAGLYTRAFNLPVVALRYFNVYGPGQSPDSQYAAAIPIFIQRLINNQSPTIFGDGHQVRDFVYVQDIVQANLLAASSAEASGQVMNICSGQETDLLVLIETLGQVLGARPEPVFSAPRPGDIYRSIGDPARAAQVMGFSTQTTLYDGLKKTVDWMRS